jgi:hypothetical protein
MNNIAMAVIATVIAIGANIDKFWNDMNKKFVRDIQMIKEKRYYKGDVKNNMYS